MTFNPRRDDLAAAPADRGGCGRADNVVMPDLDPASVIEAIAAVQRRRVFVKRGRIQIHARQTVAWRRLPLDRDRSRA
jgi:hypothetical protein